MATDRAIAFGSLVGAQLTALIEAEAESAETSTRYIEAVGFERKDDKLGLRMVEFEMVRRDVDGQDRVHRISIPALTLVPVPLLAIESAQIDFQAKVEDFQELRVEGEDSTTGNSEGSRLSKIFGKGFKREKMITRLARSDTQETRTQADLKVTVKLAQSPLPLGIERLLEASDLTVRDVIVSTPDD